MMRDGLIKIKRKKANQKINHFKICIFKILSIYLTKIEYHGKGNQRF